MDFIALHRQPGALMDRFDLIQGFILIEPRGDR